LVKGGDYSIENVVGADTVRDAGGEVALIPILKGYSTSDLISRIKKN
jgi:D-beta-D-heptose 7-phosphate kinase/D-beta-D-heptose 1-phosphate adenosyltransferase